MRGLTYNNNYFDDELKEKGPIYFWLDRELIVNFRLQHEARKYSKETVYL